MDTAVLTVLVNAGVAGIVIVLLIMGWLVPKWAYSKLEEENRLLREALSLERQRNGEVVSQMGITNQLVGALVELAESRKPDRGKDLTWKDVSL
jgi:hypothetical protein